MAGAEAVGVEDAVGRGAAVLADRAVADRDAGHRAGHRCGGSSMAWMVIRVRGTIHARHDIIDTLDFLHLTRPNHATVLPEAASFKGMLVKVQGYVTWGEAEPETVNLLLKERGETVDGNKLDDKTLGEMSRTNDLNELTRSVLAQGLVRASGIRPLFRLKAPKGGWRSTKKPFALGGALGYRGRAINDLARKML